ncbi:hypothetical protein [Jatrophihabitans fulvus]
MASPDTAAGRSTTVTTLHRIEALPGEGRYAVGFRRADGGEQSAVAQLDASGAVHLAESALPAGLPVTAVSATVAAVAAFDAARRAATPSGAVLRDVEGGWDVGLGNVVLGASGRPECTAHGELVDEGGVWVCAECGARALL